MKNSLSDILNEKHSDPTIHSRLNYQLPDSQEFIQESPTKINELWSDYWKLPWPTSSSDSTLSPEIESHPLHFLSGDLLLIGGFYGSHLKNSDSNLREWLSLDMILGLKMSNVHLPLNKEPCIHEADGIIQNIGILDICSKLVKKLLDWELKSNGNFKFHSFSYDWRQDGQNSSLELQKKLQEIYANNGNKPITVIAHSMGGLIALSTLNKYPYLFKGVVFCGTPFAPVPLILWAFQKGAPFATLFSSELHFSTRSSFIFLPQDGKAIVDKKDQDILIDYFNADEWLEHKLSKSFKNSYQSELDIQRSMKYLKDSLKKAKEFQYTLGFNSSIKYPPFVVVSSDMWPTATRIKGYFKNTFRKSQTSELHLSRPCHFEPGDGIVTKEGANMPPGYEYAVVNSSSSHVSILNDIKSITKALQRIFGHIK